MERATIEGSEQQGDSSEEVSKAGSWERCDIHGLETYCYRFRPRTVEIARALADYALTKDFDAYQKVVNES